MRLNKSDIQELKQHGMSCEDICDILLWGDDVKCFIETPEGKEKRISYKKTISIIGRMPFLWSIHRAMYHRTTSDGNISFVNTKWGV